ncbi:hypothetical protein CEUSTIGMA_g320.t1 [Chlamydomonas eustigma]|uniref:Uncharacterized protein n=1 Tax=Chlamydomonas eustigma TaxID=1157962 RepID=A0A250WPT4_9CHLO|nr:hypothetical protein CEUSTIGMA_g320.t1 [Chlamydomonas eustigma]|eukprot:GAX72865.1 hypothetical protein CEUSTIGMA_g320.t1 [Chlamydomonas eustigma]
MTYKVENVSRLWKSLDPSLPTSDLGEKELHRKIEALKALIQVYKQRIARASVVKEDSTGPSSDPSQDRAEDSTLDTAVQSPIPKRQKTLYSARVDIAEHQGCKENEAPATTSSCHPVKTVPCDFLQQQIRKEGSQDLGLHSQALNNKDQDAEGFIIITDSQTERAGDGCVDGQGSVLKASRLLQPAAKSECFEERCVELTNDDAIDKPGIHKPESFCRSDACVIPCSPALGACKLPASSPARVADSLSIDTFKGPEASVNTKDATATPPHQVQVQAPTYYHQPTCTAASAGYLEVVPATPLMPLSASALISPSAPQAQCIKGDFVERLRSISEPVALSPAHDEFWRGDTPASCSNESNRDATCPPSKCRNDLEANRILLQASCSIAYDSALISEIGSPRLRGGDGEPSVTVQHNLKLGTQSQQQSQRSGDKVNPLLNQRQDLTAHKHTSSESAWELHMPGSIQAVFACNSGRTLGSLVCSGEISNSIQGSDKKVWELSLLTIGSLNKAPELIGSLPLKPQPAVMQLADRLHLPSTMQLTAEPIEYTKHVGTKGLPSEHVGTKGLPSERGRRKATQVVVACGAWQAHERIAETCPKLARAGEVIAADKAGVEGKDGHRPVVCSNTTTGGPGLPLMQGGKKTQHGVHVLALCHDSGAWTLSSHLAASFPTLCVLVVQAWGLVIAAGRLGQAHVWCYKTGSCDYIRQSFANKKAGETQWDLPAAAFKGLQVNEIVELRVANGPKCSQGLSQQQQDGCLVLGCASDGTIVIWDILASQLLSTVHIPLCDISCVLPIYPSKPLWPLLAMAKVSEHVQSSDHHHPVDCVLLEDSRAKDQSHSRVLLVEVNPSEACLSATACPLLDKAMDGSLMHTLMGRPCNGDRCVRSVSCMAVHQTLVAVSMDNGGVTVWDMVKGDVIAILDISASPPISSMITSVAWAVPHWHEDEKNEGDEQFKQELAVLAVGRGGVLSACFISEN